jgi:hypothetical protein
LYPDVEGQSSPERPASRAERPLRQAFARALLWMLGITTFLALSAYAIGGRAVFRRLLQFRTRALSRIEESLQPPSQAEVAAARAAAAARDTASVMASDKPPSASAAFIIASIVVLIALVVVAFYVTGRRTKRSEHR